MTAPRTRALPSAIERGLEVLAATQDPGGSWKGDYGGPLFLVPVYVAGLELLGRPPDPATREGFITYLRGHQNQDGGWGLDVESHSHVFTSVLVYVSLRLLGISAEDPQLQRARAWFAPHGGPLSSGSWGKFILAILGLYSYEGLVPVPPELWLLPESLPLHPSKLWCHCRMVYLPMSWLYGRRVQAKETPLLGAIRREIYTQPYETVDWAAARERVADTDAYTPRTAYLRAANAALGLWERVAPAGARERSLEVVLDQIRREDEATNHICIGPINKVLNTVVWQIARPDGPEVEAHVKRLPDYLWRAPDGLKMQGYNSSELWDTAFAVQGILATGQVERMRPVLERAAHYIESNQVIEDVREMEKAYRHRSRGGWPFSTRAHGWPISDCTAEGLKASLLLEKAGLNQVPRARLREAVEEILSLQNEDGGWATYELQRGPRWLEALNPSDVFSTIMVDVSYVECTSACVQALAAWSAFAPEDAAWLREPIRRGERFIRQVQRTDGSWEGSWGVCFSYGAWFGTAGLIAAGARPDDPALQRAADYLQARQRTDGSWSETLESNRERRWVDGKTGHAVQTSWALLSLAACGRRDSEPVRQGVAWLRKHQGEDGRWPDQPITGVFNRTCAIHYDIYLRLMPVWALAVCGAESSPGRR
ncbi:MAG TPA: 2,3-oxidosqualene cyclase [Myxococcaceae bacterium]|nr:2,3-oxidosqualene cyclase [Myxococcaceae bacterium]